MQKRLFFWELAGFLFTSALGTVLHFVYEWSGGALAAAFVSAVNESTWEHMKLLFVPMLLFSAVQVWAQREPRPNFWAVRALSTAAGLVLIPVLYYTYTGVWGQMRPWANIAVFFLAALGAFWLDFCLLRRSCLDAPWQQVVGGTVLAALALCFVWCTFFPPHIALWRDPITGSYGI